MAISLRLAAPPSDAEIAELSQRNPGFQFERNAAGELIVTPASSEGGRREAVLVAQLSRWADDHGGVVFGPSAGFRLPDGSLFAPDASWMPKARWGSLTPEQRDDFARLCPDAVFEVASKSDTVKDLRAKMRTYLANGARLAVLVDPQHQAVEVYLPDRDVQVSGSSALVPLDPVLPGFVLDPAPIFG
ncbi:MAG: Uma2 family endonuclease [Armatimonadota bacterium]